PGRTPQPRRLSPSRVNPPPFRKSSLCTLSSRPTATGFALFLLCCYRKQFVESTQVNGIYPGNRVSDFRQLVRSGFLHDLDHVRPVLDPIGAELGFHPACQAGVACPLLHSKLLRAGDRGWSPWFGGASFGHDIDVHAVAIEF